MTAQDKSTPMTANEIAALAELERVDRAAIDGGRADG